MMKMMVVEIGGGSYEVVDEIEMSSLSEVIEYMQMLDAKKEYRLASIYMNSDAEIVIDFD